MPALKPSASDHWTAVRQAHHAARSAEEKGTISEIIRWLYAQHRPDKADDVDALLEEWRGEERLLLAKVKAKYTGQTAKHSLEPEPVPEPEPEPQPQPAAVTPLELLTDSVSPLPRMPRTPSPELDAADDALLEQAATCVQAHFRGYQGRHSSALQDLQQASAGRRNCHPPADDPEFRHALEVAPSALLDAAFLQVDANRNGSLTQCELEASAFSELLTNRWHNLDADNDGVITRAEWHAYFAKMQKRAVERNGPAAGEQQYRRFVASLIWQAEVDVSSLAIEPLALMRAVRTPATPVSGAARVAPAELLRVLCCIASALARWVTDR